MKNQIVFLGPEGATFSYEAYEVLSNIFRTPKLDDEDSVLLPVTKNEEILSKLLEIGGGYGVIAMETKAQGRVVEPVESFINLLDCTGECPIRVIGAIKMKLHFVLMARNGVKKENLKKVVAHSKALGACSKNVFSLGMESITSSSNGQAALDVATKDDLKDCAAIGPISAAKKYNLSVLSEEFEDEEAVTTFFLLGSGNSESAICKNNRALIVYKLKHESGSLVDSLIPFKDENLNLIHIHSAYIRGGYDFAMELEIGESKIQNFQRAIEKFRKISTNCLVFGPFGIV
jgi:prephenate dehydratase